MASKSYFAFFIPLLISGCVMTEEPKPQTEEAKPPPVTLTEKRTDITSPVTSVEPDPVQSAQPEPLADKTISKDEIRFVQARMKVVGFDPGPVDGVMGPKTKTALRRFQAACESLSDLLDAAGTEGFQKIVDSQAPKLSAGASGAPTKSRTPGKDEIRLLQVRLKTAGLDPGPIDGIMGPKTRSQIVAAQSGCALLRKFPAISNPELQTLEQQAPAGLASKKRTQPVASPAATPAAASSNNQVGPQNMSRKKHWLVPMRSN